MRLRGDVVPPVVAVAVGFWGVTVPSFWRDESVSAMAAVMPLRDLWRLLGAIDAVHALYYLLLRPFAAIGTNELVLRLPSVVATALAAYGVAVVGRRLASERAGVVAGVVYALMPIVSRYAQETRSYALVTAVAVLATWTLLNALEDRRWSRFAFYAASLALLGWLHLFALLIVLAHGVTVLAWRRRELLRWGAAVAGAMAVVAPLALVASREREQVLWLQRPGPADLLDFAHQAGGTWWAVGLLGVLVVAGTVCAFREARPLALVALPWAFLPVLASFAISQVEPIYHPRYLLFCVPAVALLAGAAFLPAFLPSFRPSSPPSSRPAVLPAALRGWRSWVVPVVVVGLLAALTVPAQILLRQPDARPDDLRTLSSTLSAEIRPGDAVLFVPFRYRLFVGVYGSPYRVLDDLTYAPGRAKPRSRSQFRMVAGEFQRVWMVSAVPKKYCPTDVRCQALIKDSRFRRTTQRRFGRIFVTLYTRR
ncbi:glycosyltransferase family 39 protein [Planotetraspora sp. GP83]|uniref:glycosyltransferase family 39 protein n=1 Tax=Planotetraspora sp. GP83 TaxID=3156264 RepID=UPI00351139B1